MSGCPAGSAARRRSQRLAEERLGLGVAAGRLQQTGQVVEADGDVRMPGGQRGPANVERLAVERLGLGGAAGRIQQPGQVVEAGGDVRVPGGQRGAAQVERLAVGAARPRRSGRSNPAGRPGC